MADNIELDAGSGGATVAADDVGGVHYQVVKLDVGADGVAAPVSNSNPVPVSDAGGTLTVDGTVAVTGVSTAAKQDTAQTTLTAIEAATEATQAAVEGTLTVSGTVAVTNAGLTELAAAINGSSQMDVNIAASNATVAVSNAGLTELAAAVNGSSQLDVNLAASNATITVASHAVTNAGTFAVQNTAQASTNTQEIVGDAADDAATAGNPVLVGAVAVETDGTDPTTVSAEGDVAYNRADRARRLLVSTVHPRLFRASADYASAQTNTTVQAAAGAGLSLYVTDVVISNGATAGNVTLLDGSGGTVLLEIYPAINGGVSHTFHTPLRLTANTLLAITSTTVTTHSVMVSGYIAP